MNTVIEKTSETDIDMRIIRRAAEIIRGGGLVAFPTETVYGLGANALDGEAARKIYAAKGRPSDNPLIVHIADLKMLAPLVQEISPVAETLMKKFWPGPMTLIFKKSDIVPRQTIGGLDTVAVRYPSNQIALALIREAGTAIAAPSGNLSGRPSPTEGEHIIEDMNGRIDMIIDGGTVGMGLESTIVDVTVQPPMILRPGFITREMLRETVGEIDVDPAILKKPDAGFQPKAPGMKYRHYAPKADYQIYRGKIEKVAQAIIRAANEKAAQGFKTGVITVDEHQSLYTDKLHRDVIVVSMGSLKNPETVANHLFKVLRDFDKENAAFIFGEAFSEKHVGQAIMNRLTKAAGYQVIDL